MVRGYIRVSTRSQQQGTSLEDQRRMLLAEGCQMLYEDVSSGATLQRPDFERLRADVQPGDTIIAAKLDRIARTETEAYELIKGWMDQGVVVRILNMGTLDNTEMGRLILHIMLAFAEFERDLIASRLQGGRAYKRATDPAYKEGRKAKFTEAQIEHAMTLLADHSYSDVEDMTGISRSTLTRAARRYGIRKESPFAS